MSQSIVPMNNNVVKSDQRRSPDPLMTDWDDDNVIVIDLTEERLLSSATQSEALDSEADDPPNGLESSFVSNDVSLIDGNVSSPTLDSSVDRRSRKSFAVSHSDLDQEEKPFSSTTTTGSGERASSAESTASTATSGSSRSQVNALDNDFHCKDFGPTAAKGVAKNGKNGGTSRRPIFQSLSIDRGKAKPSLAKASKSMSMSVDENCRNGSSKSTVLTRLHQEIYENSTKMKIFGLPILRTFNFLI